MRRKEQGEIKCQLQNRTLVRRSGTHTPPCIQYTHTEKEKKIYSTPPGELVEKSFFSPLSHHARNPTT